MAKKTVWLVGVGGSGRTTVAVALAAFHAYRPGIVCALSVETGGVCRFDSERRAFNDDTHEPALMTDADLLFVEVRPDRFNAAAAGPGDLVVKLERMGAAPAQGVAHA